MGKNEIMKCESCNVYPKQANKNICVKCEKMGFVVGDEVNNNEVRRKHFEWFDKVTKELFPENLDD